MPRAAPARRRRLRRTVPAGVALLALGAAAPLAYARSAVQVGIHGPADGTLIGGARLAALTFRVDTAAGLRLTLDGRPVTGHRVGATVVYRPGHLADGRHVFRAQASGVLGLHHAAAARTFTVDTTPPALAVAPLSARSPRAPVTVTGRTDGVRVNVDGHVVAVHDGTFSVTLPAAPADVRVVAADAAGNTAAVARAVTVTHPLMRGVHMTASAWAYAPLREPVLAMARAHLINTIELDVKDEAGLLGFRSTNPIARADGADGGVTYDPRAVIPELHKLGVRVVGRIVAFRDPKLATWAWTHGHRDWVVQTPAAGPWGSGSSYGSASFTNFANPNVQRYNEAIAAEAARLGFDDVMYDYVRRPDGPIAQMRFPGIHADPQVLIADFVRDTRPAVRAAGAFLGAAVFGVSATRPAEVAQNIPLIARYADYISPMVYPSHWGPGEYGVADPNADPYAIVRRSLADFRAKTRGTRCQVLPWLQDFSLGLSYGVPQVQAQIRAARDDGLTSFLLWNAGASYHAGALTKLSGAAARGI